MTDVTAGRPWALRGEWLTVVVGATVATLLGYVVLSRLWIPSAARRWLLPTVVVLGYELALCWYFLPRNHDADDGTLYLALGPGTILTLARGVLIAFLAGFLLVSRPAGRLLWIPAVLYGVASLADRADGALARLTGHVTELGARLDAEIDALGTLVAVLLAVLYGQLPVWYLLASAVHYLFLLGRWSRRRTGKPVFDLPPRFGRSVLGAAQIVLLTAALSPLFAVPVTTVLAAVVVVPLVLGFVRDWWYVSGRLMA